MRLCQKCGQKPTWSEHQHCRFCIDCSDPLTVKSLLRKREKTRARQRQGPPVAFDVNPFRESKRDQKHAPVTVPLPLMALRGDPMTRSEVAAVLGMTDWGVALLEKRALQKFQERWEALFGCPEPTSQASA